MSAPHESKEGLSSLQIVFLVLAGFLLLVALGAGFSKSTPAGEDSSADDRIAPVASVEVSNVAANAGQRSGEELFNSACTACHTAGVMGAPKAHDKAAWQARLGGNLKALVAVAMKGKGSMPPKGGVADATEEEITKAVEFMMK
ncbi:MAG TPA: c-type cytochrome [Rhodocyclaceae bacterium]|jgi:cytochrome c5|nr:c-type cytochrome [Rhodocyclaceae bacterium]